MFYFFILILFFNFFFYSIVLKKKNTYLKEENNGVILIDDTNFPSIVFDDSLIEKLKFSKVKNPFLRKNFKIIFKETDFYPLIQKFNNMKIIFKYKNVIEIKFFMCDFILVWSIIMVYLESTDIACTLIICNNSSCNTNVVNNVSISSVTLLGSLFMKIIFNKNNTFNNFQVYSVFLIYPFSEISEYTWNYNRSILFCVSDENTIYFERSDGELSHWNNVLLGVENETSGDLSN